MSRAGQRHLSIVSRAGQRYSADSLFRHSEIICAGHLINKVFTVISVLIQAASVEARQAIVLTGQRNLRNL